MLLALGLGPAEIAIILVIVILVFGPSKLPQLGSSVGKMLRGFKSEMKEIEADKAKAAAKEADDDRTEIDVTPVSDAPPKGD
jgi:sec-independent protein translocase protein TatA